MDNAVARLNELEKALLEEKEVLETAEAYYNDSKNKVEELQALISFYKGKC